MKVADSILINEPHELFITAAGKFYFFDCTVISEINEGITFTWSEAEIILSIVDMYYDECQMISYISNRVNSYSINPTDWLKFRKYNERMGKYIVVSQSKTSIFSTFIEQRILKKDIKRLTDLVMAYKIANPEVEQKVLYKNVGI